jgi:Ca2+-transporting ATPase
MCYYSDMSTQNTPESENSPSKDQPPWHVRSLEEVQEELDADLEGLTGDEAAARLKRFGPNELQESGGTSAWALFWGQFKNVLILILLIAAGLSVISGHDVEAIAIGAIAAFTIVLGFIQEYRSEKAIAALREMAAPSATVLRDGREEDIPARKVVPGDVLQLHTGDKVPADARLIEAVNLQLVEAALTGESLPVEKDAGSLDDPDLPLGDRTNMVYSGTAVSYGRGRALAVATGMQTEFGRIARMLETVDTARTPLQKNLDRVGRILAWVALGVVAAVVAVGVFRGEDFIEMAIFGIALAVAVVPEALPAVVTISLALGARRLVRRNALMRRLPVVETLGSTTVICADKTGTLTRNEMTVRNLLVGGREIEITGTGYRPEGVFRFEDAEIEPDGALKSLLRAGALASDARLEKGEKDGRWVIKGDPTEGALVVVAAKAGLDKAELEDDYPRVDEIPFSSESRRMTTFHEGPEGRIAFSKGAPEIILASCERRQSEEGEVPLDEEGRDNIMETARKMAEHGLRVLAASSKVNTDKKDVEQGMTFLGLFGMIDPPRSEAHSAIKTCRQAGIKPVMITGDHPLTARAVARDLDLLENGRLLEGADLERMSDEEFAEQVREIECYARVSPEHKLRVVEALQSRGERVAMTGDGVNDAPALKKADIGIAMAITGTDVTREAADMTLTDDNFASIVAAIEEGRGIFSNIKKYLMYLLSSNLAEIGLIGTAALAGLPTPLTALQILYLNLATDGLPALALAVDPAEPDLMERPPRDPRQGVFTPPVVFLMSVAGFWIMTVGLTLFLWAMHTGRSADEAMTMTFVCLVLIEFFNAYNFRSDRHTVLSRPFANRWLNLAVGWEILLLGLVVYVPFLQQAFHTYTLPPIDWLIAVVLAFSVSPVLELAKWLVRRRLAEV